MNKRIKKINMLAVAALLITGSAVAMSGATFQTPTHYNANPNPGLPNWQPIPAGFIADCDPIEELVCTAIYVDGNYVPNADRGLAKLIEVD